MGVARWTRIVVGVTTLIVVESLVLGLSIVPTLALVRFLLDVLLPLAGRYGGVVLLGFIAVPAYLTFSIALIFLTATATRLFRWRSTEGHYPLAELPWPVIRWAQYNAASHVVRLLVGTALRATPLWTWFLRLNGARMGRDVHVNTLSIYDHNLLRFGDHVVVGSDVKLSSHVVEGGKLWIAPVVFGNEVTIGTNSIVQPGVVAEDGARVGTLSLVPKGMRLEAGKLYGGVPVQVIHAEA